MMTSKERKTRLESIGYRLERNKKCSIDGKTYPYRTVPCLPTGYNTDMETSMAGGGPTNYFKDAVSVDRYIVKVEQVREWQR